MDDLELDTEPADPNAAARTADPKAVLDARDAPPAAHETVEQAVKDAHENENPDSSNMEATNRYEAVQDARNQNFSSNPELGLPGSNLNTSRPSGQSDLSDPSEQYQSDLEVEPP